jgi:hypothetical protein
MIGLGTLLFDRQAAALNRSDVVMLRNQQNPRTPSKRFANRQGRYGYLEKAFVGGPFTA